MLSLEIYSDISTKC